MRSARVCCFLLAGACGSNATVDAGIAPARDASFIADATGTTTADAETRDAEIRDADAPDAGPACPPAAPAPSAPSVVLEPPFLFEHPIPSGAFAVGTHIIHWNDILRSELGTADFKDTRELVVQLFYPTDVRDGPPAPLMEPEVAELFEQLGLPPSFNTKILTRSTFDVPLSNMSERWPVAIYSHDLRSARIDNQPLAEELASHGYVVVTLSHPYQGIALLSDGRVSIPTFEGTPPNPTPDDLEVYIRRANTLMSNVWVPDTKFILDRLERANALQPCTWLSGRLDLTRVALLGHGFGGATAFQTCPNDQRCIAALNLDGANFGALPAATNKPLMFIKSELPEPTWDPLQRLATGATYTVRIEGAEHRDFTSLSLRTSRAEQIARAYAKAFLDKHLRTLEAPLLDGPSPYAEARYDDGASEAITIAGRARLETSLPAAGAEVRILGTNNATIAGARGFFAFEDLPAPGPYAVTVDHPDAHPLLFTVENHGRLVELPHILHRSRPTLEDLAMRANITIDPLKGTLILRAARSFHHHLIGPAPNIEITAGSGEGPHDLDGDAVFFNVDPGIVALTVSPSCALHTVLIEPGYASFALAACD